MYAGKGIIFLPLRGNNIDIENAFLSFSLICSKYFQRKGRICATLLDAFPHSVLSRFISGGCPSHAWTLVL